MEQSKIRFATPCGSRPTPYLPLLGTLFVFILAANWSSLISGHRPPDGAHRDGRGAGLIVFFAMI